jgi:3-oxoacid CoA-transferase B subunit
VSIQIREFIAKNAATLLQDGDIVNLGVGIPISVPKYLPRHVHIMLHAEAGALGCAAPPNPGEGDRFLIDASGAKTTLIPGGCCFDSAISFGMVRGGFLDTSILGAFQVDVKGNMANWLLPGKLVVGMGGAMDIAMFAKKVIVTMEHISSKGEKRVVEKCTLPLTVCGKVTDIVTDLAIIAVTRNGLALRAIAPGVTVEEVKAKTGVSLVAPEELPLMIL